MKHPKTPIPFPRTARKVCIFCVIFTFGILSFTGCHAGGNASDAAASVASVRGGRLEASRLFTRRDLTQTADLSGAVRITVTDGQDVSVNEAGVYVISGRATDVTVVVRAGADDDVQLVLDNVSIANRETPCIVSQKADRVYLTLVGENSLLVSNRFAADVSSPVNGAVYAGTNLTCNGTGSLTVTSPANGIVCKDDLKITGGAYTVNAASNAIRANDSVCVAGGSLTLTAGTDGIHAENSDNDSLGYLYIGGGHMTVHAEDDGLHATSVLQIDRGELDITAGEGMEATDIQINDGTVRIQARDDGINAAHKSKSLTPSAEINGGSVTISIDSPDGDAIDSNGNIYINGGSVSVTASSAFDCDGQAWFNGGSVTVNGQPFSGLPSGRP